MKISLEFEESDLREMIGNHFGKAGFVVKNLESICDMFATAFPEGIKVIADIAAQPETEEPAPEQVQRVPFEAPPPGIVYTDDDNPPMGISDLFDPTPNPRIGRVERNLNRNPAVPVSNDVASIEKLVRLSQDLDTKSREH